MLIALKRFELSERTLKIITSLYTNATFFTKNVLSGEISSSVGSEIRQGCPLSSYLFIIVLTVILEDVELEFVRITKIEYTIIFHIPKIERVSIIRE